MMVDFWAGTYGEECGIFKLREFEALDRFEFQRKGRIWLDAGLKVIEKRELNEVNFKQL